MDNKDWNALWLGITETSSFKKYSIEYIPHILSEVHQKSPLR